MWTPYAFVRIVAFLIVGILSGIYLPALLPVHILLVAIAFFILVYFVLAIRKPLNVNAGPVGLALIFLIGYLNTLYHTESRNADHILHHKDFVASYRVVISGYPEEKANSWKVEARVQSVHDGRSWHFRSGKVLLYFSKKDFQRPFAYGDVLLVRGAPKVLQDPLNPGEFDYKRFLSFRKIYHQHFLKRDMVQYVSHNPPYRVVEFSMKARSWADAEVKKHVPGDKERAVASAILLGVRDGLDNELVSAYSASGAMHVLAVSGLHVGIIFLILNFFLKPLRRVRYGKWALAVISLVVLWSYAFVTGLSPSVLRAVTMFSFVVLAHPLSYRTNIYNTLAVAAFCLLLWEPYLIMSVGFQLSFMAVIGIVYLQPRLYRLWEPSGWLLDKTWQITCVSLSAQAATFALGILYFHQFPVYFLVSNLFVIPGALLSLSLGIALLAVSPFGIVSNIIGILLNTVLKGLNYLVFLVEQLPFSLIDNLYISTFQSWMLLGVILFFALLFEFRQFRYALAIMCCCAGFGAAQWWHHFDEVRVPKLVVYQVNGHSAIEWVDRGQSYFVTDSVLLRDREKVRFHIRPNRLINRVNRVYAADSLCVRNVRGSRLFVFDRRSVLQITDRQFTAPEGLEVDYLVLSNNAVKHLAKLSQVRFSTLIVDGSNSTFLTNQILDDAVKRGIEVYCTSQKGAFTVNL